MKLVKTVSAKCRLCNGIASIRAEYYPAPYWKACPNCKPDTKPRR